MKILHIEDVSEISQIFADILSTKNYDFDSVSDGRAGLELAVSQNYAAQASSRVFPGELLRLCAR